jgi:hypothetical protein
MSVYLSTIDIFMMLMSGSTTQSAFAGNWADGLREIRGGCES